MKGFNKTNLIDNLGKDVEINTLEGGISVVNYTNNKKLQKCPREIQPLYMVSCTN